MANTISGNVSGGWETYFVNESGDETLSGSLKIDNIKINGNAITSEDTDGDVTITPNGTGDVIVDGHKFPQSDGNASDVLKTDGAGQLAWAGVEATIPSDSVTYDMIQDITATDLLLGRSTAGAGTVEEVACTSFARSILDDANEAAFKATINLEIGTDVQAYDATLGSISALGTGADKLAYTTGVDTWAEASVTAAGLALLDDANAAAQLTTLGAAASGSNSDISALTALTGVLGWTGGGFIRVDTKTIADDATATFSALGNNNLAVYVLVCSQGVVAHAIFSGDAANLPVALANGGSVEFATADLAGTTGTDGKCTISPSGSSTTLEIENRLGATRNFTLFALAIS